MIENGQLYQHFKGGRYQVMGRAEYASQGSILVAGSFVHTETGFSHLLYMSALTGELVVMPTSLSFEPLVIYRNLEDFELVWGRPESMFLGRLPDGRQRFTLLDRASGCNRHQAPADIQREA